MKENILGTMKSVDWTLQDWTLKDWTLTDLTLQDWTMADWTMEDECVQLPHVDHRDASDEIQRLQITERCKRRAEEEDLPLRQIFDDVCRASAAAGQHVSFADLEKCTSVAVSHSRHYQRLLRRMTLLFARVATCNSTTATSIAVLLTPVRTMSLWCLPATNNWRYTAQCYRGVLRRHVQSGTDYILPALHGVRSIRWRCLSSLVRDHVAQDSGIVR